MPIRIPLEIFPILTVVYTLAGLVITFCIAFGLNHIDRTIVPYISETGIHTPENGIFTIVMFGTSILLLITMLIRFKQVWDNTAKRSAMELIINIMNCIAFLLGVIAVIGVLLIGSYRMSDDYTIHDIAVNVSIPTSLFYYTFQTAISPLIKPKLKIRWLLLGIRVCIILLIIILGTVYSISFDNHSVSASIEWALIAVVYSYFLTFVPEFHKLNINLKVGMREVELGMERVWHDGKLYQQMKSSETI